MPSRWLKQGWVPTPMMKRTSESARYRAGTLDGSAAVLSHDALRGRALAMLARRDHSRLELSRKLLEQGGATDLVEAVLHELAERGLQSDARFAEVFVRSRAERGCGPRTIMADLRGRGVDGELAEQALEASGYDWQQQASALRERRFGRAVPVDMREKARQLRFLQYRGFSGAQAGRALRCDSLDDD